MERKELSDKQTQAVISNFKEQRCLEKSLINLSLEESYAINILNLSNKVLKVRYKRLKNKVNQINSYLSRDDIKEMKKLEQTGELEEATIKLNSSVRISAAAKRLKLLPTKRSKSAVPRLSTEKTHIPAGSASVPGTPMIRVQRQNWTDERSAGNCISLLSSPPRQRSNDTKSVFSNTTAVKTQDTYIDTSSGIHSGRKSVDFTAATIEADERKMQRSSTSASTSRTVSTARSAQSGVSSTPLKLDSAKQSENAGPPLSVKYLNQRSYRMQPRPVSTSHLPVEKVVELTERPATTSLLLSVDANIKKKMSTVDQEEMARISKRISEGFSRAPFSCHSKSNKERVIKELQPFRSIRDNILTNIDDEIEQSFGSDMHKDFKKGLKLNEAAQSLKLEDKIDSFLERTETYVKENPVHFGHENEIKVPPPSGIEKRKIEEKSKKPRRNQLRRRQLEETLSLGQPKKQTVDVWKDVNKCRYLRVPEEMIDLSGIVTLAQDQMKLFDAMKFQE